MIENKDLKNLVLLMLSQQESIASDLLRNVLMMENRSYHHILNLEVIFLSNFQLIHRSNFDLFHPFLLYVFTKNYLYN
jgi:hypothetical protein